MLRFQSSTMLYLICIVVALSQAASSKDILDNISNSQAELMELVRLETEHTIAAVKDAIAKCRAGNYSDAVPVLTEYTDKGDLGATFVLAKMYLDGLGVEKSIERAVKLYEKTAEDGHTPSMMVLAEVKAKESPAEALQFYKQASALDDMRATLNLGLIYEQGLLGTKANPKLALNYFQRVAKAGQPAGDFYVARCYERGVGVSPNELQATRLYLKSALAGFTNAQVVMARRYFAGSGLEKDPVAAFGWLTRASEGGSTEAMVLLGQRYQFGDVISKNLNKAGQLYSNAAKKGDPTGRYHLALLYLNGVGTKADPVRAYVLLHSARQLPKAELLYAELSEKLTPAQINEAKKKIAEGKGN